MPENHWARRHRPERIKTQWSDILNANHWYAAECAARGVDREEALQFWESLTPTARIRRWREALRSHVQRPGPAEGHTPPPKEHDRDKNRSEETRTTAPAT